MPTSDRDNCATKNSNGTKALVGVLGLLASILAIFAVAMFQRLNHLDDQLFMRNTEWRRELDGRAERWERELNVIRKEVQLDDRREVADQGNFATIDRKFEEVETQFDWLKDVVNIQKADHERMVALLWQRVYDENLPAVDYWPLGNED